MNSQIIVAAIQGGSQLINKILDKRPIKQTPMQSESPEEALSRIYGTPIRTAPTESPVSQIIVTDVTDEVEEEPCPTCNLSEKKVGTACIACGLSHIATCAGALNEAVRFAREDITSNEVVKRINTCVSEIAICEREDLSPVNIVKLNPEEKALADTMATEIRDIRHGLEWFKSKEDIEELAAKAAILQEKVNREWLKIRLKALTPEEKAQVKAKVQERLGEGLGGLLEDGQKSL